MLQKNTDIQIWLIFRLFKKTLPKSSYLWKICYIYINFTIIHTICFSFCENWFPIPAYPYETIGSNAKLTKDH